MGLGDYYKIFQYVIVRPIVVLMSDSFENGLLAMNEFFSIELTSCFSIFSELPCLPRFEKP